MTSTSKQQLQEDASSQRG